MTQPYTPPTEELAPETRTPDDILASLVGQEAWDLIKPVPSDIFDGDALSDALTAEIGRHRYHALCMTAEYGSAIHSMLVQAMNAGDCIETTVDARDGDVLAAARQAAGGVATYLNETLRSGQCGGIADVAGAAAAMKAGRSLIAIRHQARGEYVWLMSRPFWRLLAAQVAYWRTLDLDRPCGGLFDEEWTHDAVSHRDACEALFFDIAVA